MKSKHLPLVALALGIGTLPSSAGHRSFGDGLPGYLEQYDVNDDGVIDEEERQAIKAAREAAKAAFIAEWDTDGDGELSSDEKEAYRDAIRAEIEAKRIERFNELAGEDGLLSLEEFAAIPGIDQLDAERVAALYARMDADESGAVTVDEFNKRLRHHRSGHSHHGGLTDEEKAAAAEAKRVAAYDALAGEPAEDGSTSISAEEFAAAYPNLDATQRDEVFAAADLDGSGDLSLDEFTYDYKDLAEDEEDAARDAAREAAAEAKRVEAFDALAGEPAEDGSSSITLEEFLASQPDADPTEVEAAFVAMDTDGSGEVTLDEFTYEADHDHDHDHNHHRGRHHYTRHFFHRR